MWLQTPANATQSRNISTCSAFNLGKNVCQYVVTFFFPFHCVDKKNLWTKFKIEINVTVEYFNLSGRSYQYMMVRPLCINMCLSIPGNEIHRINTQTSSAFNPSRDVCQYVVLIFFTFQCVDAPACHVKLRINNINYCRLNPWRDIFNDVLVCVFTFQCVGASSCEQYSNNKNLELETIKFETHKRGSIINYII